MSNSRFQMLESPFKLGKVTLRNRLVFPPFETNYATADGFPTEKSIELYRRIAAGGVGLIIIEATNVNPESRPTKYGLAISDDKYIPHFQKLTNAVHKEGVAMLLQLVDKLHELGKTPADVSKAEISKIIGYFADAALRAERCGFDGLELHAAHPHTLAAFLSCDGNKRKDEYGHNLEGRIRIIREFYKWAKQKVNPDFLFSCRFNGDEFMKGGNTLKDAMAIGGYLEKLGFNLLDISAGGRIEPIFKTDYYRAHAKPHHHIGYDDSYSSSRTLLDATQPDAGNIYLAEGVKKAVTHTPVIGCGKIGTLKLAEQVLRENKADLVAMARAIFCDPELPNKTFAGREKEILKCSWCNICHELYFADEQVVCVKWPGVKVKVSSTSPG